MATAPATSDQLAAYLARIGFTGTPRPDLATLTAVHRAHVDTIAWECIDCFIGRPTGRDPQAAFDKIVTGGRGGWCYEMNGLFAWMLEAMGFSLTRLAAGVMRDRMGDGAIGNHLTLIVHLDRDHIADVGLGAGLVEPVPFAAGTYEQRGIAFAIEDLGDGWWRFHNQPDVLPPTFDFSPAVRDEALLEGACQWLQSDPASPFRQHVVVQRYDGAVLKSLVDAGFAGKGPGAAAPRAIADAADYAATMRREYGLDPADAAAIWARIGELAPA
jgi:N-hydroxyarylamine O-acetyltransferase